MNQQRNWIPYAAAEGLVKAMGRFIQRFVGPIGGTVGHTLFAATMNGIVMMAGGIVGSGGFGQIFAVTRRQIAVALTFGLVGAGCVVLGFTATASPGADIGVISFIVALSIIPGAIIDWLYFGHPLAPRQFLAIALYLFAGWAMLDFPTLAVILHLPRWVWFAAMMAILFAVNEAISQAQAQDKMRPHPNNFWAGLGTSVPCMVAYFWLPVPGGMRAIPFLYWAVAVVFGGLSTASVYFKLISYASGGTIAFKKLVMQTVQIVLAAAAGSVFFGDPVTMGKMLAVALFAVAFILMDEKAWTYTRARLVPVPPTV